MTYYERAGKGKTVLVLHGWGDSMQSFRGLSATLREAFEVVALDLPGFGKTDAPVEAWDLTDYANFIAAFIAKIGVKKVYTIIGHSNGDAIAIRGLGAKSLASDKLVLLASSGIRGEYKGRAKALRLLAKTGKLLTKPLPKSAKKRLRKSVYESIGSDMLVVEHMQATFKKVITDDVQANAPSVKAKTLLIYGDKDTATPVRYGERLRDLIPGSSLTVLNDCGHFILHEQPEKATTAIVEFLQ